MLDRLGLFSKDRTSLGARQMLAAEATGQTERVGHYWRIV
jgi:hypothetical protein